MLSFCNLIVWIGRIKTFEEICLSGRFGILVSVFLELPVPVVEGADLSSLQPPEITETKAKF